MARMACEGECDACLVGAVAQLGERLVRNEEVSGSIPLSSTNKINDLQRKSGNNKKLEGCEGTIREH